ncbi:hypothetical protein D3C75_1151670 [compost metagenome]
MTEKTSGVFVDGPTTTFRFNDRDSMRFFLNGLAFADADFFVDTEKLEVDVFGTQKSATRIQK